MKKNIIAIILFNLIVASFGLAEVVPGEMIVVFKEQSIKFRQDKILGPVSTYTAKESIVAGIMSGVNIKREFQSKSLKNAALIKIPDGRNVESVLADFATEAGQQIIIVEPNYKWKLLGIPNDPDTGRLPAIGIQDHQRAWDEISAFPGDAFEAEAQAVIAVIDTGVDYTHPDLVDNMWNDPADPVLTAETGLYGWDYVDDTGDPMDDNGFHGTHVAGIAGAVGNNGVGVIGVCPKVKIMAMRVLDGNEGETAWIVDAINGSRERGADVINMSLGGPGYSILMYDAIRAAINSGISVCVAAGNDDQNIDMVPTYPASYFIPGMITVMATDVADQPASYTNYGVSSTDLAAFGGDENYMVYSTTPVEVNQYMQDNDISGSYAELMGTSMACPQVAGACAFMISVNRATGSVRNLSPVNIEKILVATADKLPVLNAYCSSGARLNVFGAITAAVDGNVRILEQPAGSYDNVQDAIDAANSGETILLKSDRWYTDPFLLATKDLTITSADFDPNNFDPAGVTYVDLAGDDYRNSTIISDLFSLFANPNQIMVEMSSVNVTNATLLRALTIADSGRAISCDTSAAPTIEDISITGCSWASGPGIAINTADPIINRVIISECNSRGDGGAMYIQNATTVTLTDCQLSDNIAAGDGGGIYVDSTVPSTIIIQSSTPGTITSLIDGNNAINGGAIYAGDMTTLTISDTNLSTNTVVERGAGIYSIGETASSITNSIISNNISTGNGGGICIRNGSDMGLTDCTISNNSAGVILDGSTIPNSEGSGGGLYSYRSSPVISGCTFSNNFAEFDGGALFTQFANSVSSLYVNLSDSIFDSNIANYKGGAIALNSISPTPSLLVSNLLMMNNSTDTDYSKGAAVYLYKTNAEFTNCTVADNSVSGYGSLGSAFYSTLSDLSLINSIISNNTNIAIASDDTFSFDNNLFFNNRPSALRDISVDPVVDYNDTEVLALDADAGSVSADPMFQTGFFGDYYLSQYDAGQRLTPDGLFVVDTPAVGYDPNAIDPVITNATSLAVDAGNDTSVNVALSTYSTRTDNAVDAGVVDLGYHYIDSSPEYTATETVGVDVVNDDFGQVNIIPAGPHKPFAHVLLEAEEFEFAELEYNGELYEWQNIDEYSTFYNGDGTVNDNLIAVELDSSVHPSFNPIARAVFRSKFVELRVRVEGGTGRFVYPLGDPLFYERGEIIPLKAVPLSNHAADKIVWSLNTLDPYTLSYNNQVVIPEDPITTLMQVVVNFITPDVLMVGPAGVTQFDDLDAAIYEAKEGDIIQFYPGDYYETTSGVTVVQIDKNLTIKGAIPSDPNSTVLYGTRIRFHSNVKKSTVFEGITLDYLGYEGGGEDGCSGLALNTMCAEDHDGGPGYSAYGRGMRIDSQASPVIRNVIIRGVNITGGNGGNGTATVNPNVKGDGGWPGGAYGAGAFIAEYASPRFEHCAFINCSVQGGNGGNGASPDPRTAYGGGWNDFRDTDIWDAPYSPQAPFWEMTGQGGAVYCEVGCDIDFIDCLFQGNSAFGGLSGIGAGDDADPDQAYRIPSYGGALFAEAGSDVRFTNCEFIDNQADRGAGVFLDDGYKSSGGAIAISNGFAASDKMLNYIFTNIGNIPTLVPVGLSFDSCNFNSNDAATGGAIWVDDLDGDVQMQDCNFMSNTASVGGAMFLSAGDPNSPIDLNNSNDPNSTLLMVRTLIKNNLADGLAANNPLIEGGMAGGIFAHNIRILMADTQITGNYSRGSGGGLYMSAVTNSADVPYTLWMKNCLIADNIAFTRGAGVMANAYSDPNIINCTFANNILQNTGSRGGALCLSENSYARITNSIFFGNHANVGQQIAILADNQYNPSPSGAQISYSLVQDGQAGIFVDSTVNALGERVCSLDWDADSMYPRLSNLTYDPLFVEGIDGSYYLSQPVQMYDEVKEKFTEGTLVDNPLSPCIDAGNMLAFDQDMYRHSTRIDHVIDGQDPSLTPGATLDMGYHYLKETDLVGDINYDQVVDMFDVVRFNSNYWLLDGCEFPYWCHETDFDQNGIVDGMDLAVIYDNYGNLDGTPPTPYDITWNVKPISLSGNSITMSLVTAKDNSGEPVMYEFRCLNNASLSSGWIATPEYHIANAASGTRLAFYGRAVDHTMTLYPDDQDKWNVTAWSPIAYVIPGQDNTPPVVDIEAEDPSQAQWEEIPQTIGFVLNDDDEMVYVVEMEAVVATDDRSGVEYKFICATNTNYSSEWQTSPLYVVGGFPEGVYDFVVIVRDTSSNNNLGNASVTGTVTCDMDNLVDRVAPWPAPTITGAVTDYDLGVWTHNITFIANSLDLTPPISYYLVCITSNSLSPVAPVAIDPDGAGLDEVETGAIQVLISTEVYGPKLKWRIDVEDALGNRRHSTNYVVPSLGSGGDPALFDLPVDEDPYGGILIIDPEGGAVVEDGEVVAE